MICVWVSENGEGERGSLKDLRRGGPGTGHGCIPLKG